MNVYRLFDAKDRLLYIGMSINVANRWAGHKADSSRWYHTVRKITIDPCKNKEEARHKEAKAIMKEQPLYNKSHKRSHMQNLCSNCKSVLKLRADKPKRNGK